VLPSFAHGCVRADLRICGAHRLPLHLL
jgi:hypothetical protein